MNKLTTAEELLMQILWKLGPCTISTVMEYYQKHSPKDVPAQTTVSTYLRILVDKKFLSFKAYGRTYEYSPIVSKETYSSNSLNTLIKQYFGNSPKELMSYLVESESVDIEEVKQLIQKLKTVKK